jgi:hypothetical protein
MHGRQSKANPITATHQLNYASPPPLGSGIRVTTTRHALVVHFPPRRAVGEAVGLLGHLHEYALLLLLGIPLLGGLLVYWAVKGRFSPTDDAWWVGLWLTMVAIVAGAYWFGRQRYTQIAIEREWLVIRIRASAETWRARLEEIVAVNALGGRPRIWLGGSKEFCGGSEDERLYWHDPMPEAEVAWLTSFLQEAVSMHNALIAAHGNQRTLSS